MASTTPPPLPPGYAAPDRASAESQVAGPAIGLIAGGSIGILTSLASLVLNVLGAGTTEALARGAGDERVAQLVSMAGGIVGALVGLVGYGFMIFGGLKMKSLEAYPLAMASAIVALVPCCMPCCCLTLPIGIWALVVLLDANVKASFRG